MGNCEGFASGTIDLGGLEVCKVSNLTEIWAAHEGGPGNLGATIFEPFQLPEGFSMLALEPPTDYTLVWSSETLKIKQDFNGYFWLPTPPNGYRAVGHVVTSPLEKPPLEKIRCVSSDFADVCEIESWIWGPGEEINSNGFNIHSLRPTVRGVQALGHSAGTIVAQNGEGAPSVTCLRNSKADFLAMPNLSQIQALFQAYSPWIYFHPDEQYLLSLVSWFFEHGALLYKKKEESKHTPIEHPPPPPRGQTSHKEEVKKGNLQGAGVYLHVKPMFGAIFTDIATWVFYPSNGPARAKVKFMNVSLGKIGNMLGIGNTGLLRISNFNGELNAVYFSEHSGGMWVSSPELEFQGGNKPAGLVLQGSDEIGMRNDMGKGNMVLDAGERFLVVAAEYLGPSSVVEPPWLNYAREWVPKIEYSIEDELKKSEKILPSKLKSKFEKIVGNLPKPKEVLGGKAQLGPK
ncbi:hypothetical protein NMG60_11029349 [Bertholletia excelsa]